MDLGSLIAQLERAPDPIDALVWLEDLALFAAVETMGARHDETPAAYLAGAARRFARSASDEDWLALTGALAQADDPTHVALGQMVRWALQRDEEEMQDPAPRACGCGAPAGA